MNLRMHFVTDWQKGCWTMTELCADYQISWKTGYKWVERYATHGPASPLPPIQTINEVWTTDFKGEFLTGDGRYCYPLTPRDGCSRFVLRCDALAGH